MFAIVAADVLHSQLHYLLARFVLRFVCEANATGVCASLALSAVVVATLSLLCRRRHRVMFPFAVCVSN